MFCYFELIIAAVVLCGNLANAQNAVFSYCGTDYDIPIAGFGNALTLDCGTLDGVYTMPTEVALLTRIEFLRLEQVVGTLPSVLGEMTNLELLGLTGPFGNYPESLRKLPTEIGRLENLETFICSRHDLYEIPSEIGLAVNLREMDFRGDNSRLNSIPTEIGNLGSLTELTVSDYVASALPSELGRLEILELLNVNAGGLSSLPTEIFGISTLSILRIASNSIEEIPTQVAGLTSLEHLDASNNELASLPSQLGNLAALTELELGSNDLESLPKEMDSLDSLTKLSIHNNPLKSLGPVLDISFLRELDISSIQLPSLPTEIGFSYLHSLTASYNFFTSIPTELGNLDTLTSCDLFGNPIVSVPTEIGGLSNLRALILPGEEGLQQVPLEFWSLNKLTFLTFAFGKNINRQTLPELFRPVIFGNLSRIDFISDGDLLDYAAEAARELRLDLSNAEYEFEYQQGLKQLELEQTVGTRNIAIGLAAVGFTAALIAAVIAHRRVASKKAEAVIDASVKPPPT